MRILTKAILFMFPMLTSRTVEGELSLAVSQFRVGRDILVLLQYSDVPGKIALFVACNFEFFNWKMQIGRIPPYGGFLDFLSRVCILPEQSKKEGWLVNA